jgi:hypothetical protein
MKKGVIICGIFFLLHRSAAQDYRLLQADKSKLYISTARSSDSIVRVAIINADWRLDYVKRLAPSHTEHPAASPHDSLACRAKHKLGRIIAAAEYHHTGEPLTHSFYISISAGTNVNDIINQVNNEYRSVIQTTDAGYRLIDRLLPDTVAEYYVDGYKGDKSASLEVMYLWGAPLRDWALGFSLSIHDREARKVLSTISCMDQDQTEFEVRKIRVRQASLISIMSYKDMLCQ